MTTTPALNDDLVRRIALRLRQSGLFKDAEMATALEAQSKEIEALRSALEPFVEAYEDDGYDDDGESIWEKSCAMDITVRHLRRARTAMKGA